MDDNRFSKAGQQILSNNNNSPQDYLTDAFKFVQSVNQNPGVKQNYQALERENYLRSKNALNSPVQIKNILNNTDLQKVKSEQPQVYQNYMNNVLKQDELMRKMRQVNSGLLSKEIALKNQQSEVRNMGSLNKYNNDLVQLTYKSQRKALQDFKAGNQRTDDPFLNFLQDPSIFPANQLDNNNKELNDLNTLDQLAKGLIGNSNHKESVPLGPPSGMNNEPNENSPLIPDEEGILEPSSSIPQLDPNSAIAFRAKNSIISPFFKRNSVGPPLNEPDPNPNHHFRSPSSQNNQQIPHQNVPLQPGIQTAPQIVMLPMPYPPERKSSTKSSREKGRVPEEVKAMLAKQNDMLQNFLEKMERTDTKEDYNEKYEHKIRELEKNFDLSNEILALKKQLYTFNSEKVEERKPTLPPPTIFMPNNPLSMMYPQPSLMGGMGMGMNMGAMNPYNPYQQYQQPFMQNPYFPYQTANPGPGYQNPTMPMRTQTFPKPKGPEIQSNFERLLLRLLGDENPNPNPNMYDPNFQSNGMYQPTNQTGNRFGAMTNSLDLKKGKIGSRSEDSNRQPTKLKKERKKYMRKWFRYVAFPYVWKKSVDEKIILRKVNFMKQFEENIEDIITRANDWSVKVSRGMSPLLDKNRLKNYDLDNIKKVSQKSKKEAGSLFADLKNIISLVFKDMIDNTSADKIDSKVISFLGGICNNRSFIPDYFIFPFEYERLTFSPFYGFVKNLEPMQKKMIIAFFLVTKIYMANTFINPWRVKPTFPKNDVFPNNLKSAASIIMNLVTQYFEKNIPLSGFVDDKVKPPLKIKLLEKPIDKDQGFNFKINEERANNESIPKISGSIFIDECYQFADYQWVTQWEQKWFDEKLLQIGEWVDKVYFLVHQNYRREQTFF